MAGRLQNALARVVTGINTRLFEPKALVPSTDKAAVQPRDSNRHRNSVFLRRDPHRIPVDYDAALTLDTVYACIGVITQDLGVLNHHVQRPVDGGGTERVTDIPQARMLRKQPNPEMTAQVFRETLTAHCALSGNGYAEIERNLRGEPIGLWPLLPDRTYPIRLGDGALIYLTWNQEVREWVPIPASDMLHLKGLGFNGLYGYDVVSYMSGTIGTGLAAQEYSGAFFGNGTHLSGALFHPKSITKEAADRLREQFESLYRGSANAFRMAVFEEGMDWKQLSVTPEAAKVIETRKVDALGVCRMFRVKPHKVGILDNATYSNIESQNIDHVQDTLLPWAVRWEQECDAKLFTRNQMAGGYESKINLDTLRRGDIKTRYEAYKIAREWGWLTANEIRDKENMNPAGPEGDEYIIPLNYQSAKILTLPLEDQQAKNEPAQDNRAPDAAAASAAATLRPAAKAVIQKLLNREKARGDELLSAAAKLKRYPSKRVDELVKAQSVYMINELAPVFDGIVEAFSLDTTAANIIGPTVARYTLDLEDALRKMIEGKAVEMNVASAEYGDQLLTNLFVRLSEAIRDEAKTAD